jgi:hypothetical protein
VVQSISSNQPTGQKSDVTDGTRFQLALDAAGNVRQKPANPTPANPAPAPGKKTDAARDRQIDDWVDHDSDASGGFLGFGQTSAVDHVRAALEGHTELGHLTANDERYLLDKVLARWSAGKGAGPGGAATLAQSYDNSNDSQLRGIVAERLAAEAASLMQKPAGNGSITDPHAQARAYALDAVQDATGGQGQTPADYARVREMLNGIGPDGAARFMQALNPAADGAAGYAMIGQVQQQILAAMNAGPQTQTTSAVVQTLFSEMSPGALHALPGLRTGLAKALAREWYPSDTSKQASEEGRLAGILGTEQGTQLLFGSGDSGKIPIDARVNALAIIRTDPSITAATMTRTADPWANPAILGPMARVNAQQYLTQRGDTPQTLQGTDLDNTVGFAMGLPPTVPHDAAGAEAGAANGKFSYYAQGPGHQSVQAIVDQIHHIGGANPQVTVLPIEYGSSDYGPVQLPLFRVHTAGGDRFVDNTGRSYTSFDDWRQHNQLPPGTVYYPENGHLTAGADGQVKLASGDTPSTPDTTWKKVKGVLNDVALVGGIIAGAAVIIGTDGLATPVVAAIGAASGAWGAYSTGSDLYDRSQHGQSIDPIHDSTARGLWLGLAANTAGVGAFASEAALARIASTEGTLAPATAWTIGTAKAAATVTNGAAFVNAGVDLATNWGAMTPAQRAQSVLSMGFWGATTLVGAKGARSPGDLFNPAAMTRTLTGAYEPPVTKTTSLPGNRVEIVTDPATGQLSILAGEHASSADIQLHVNVARMMARDQGLQGQIKALQGEPAPGTLAYSVKYEGIKLGQKIADLQTRLDDPRLTPQQRTQIQGDIDSLNAYLDQDFGSLESIVRSPNTASVAQPADGRARAEELPGLVDALETGPWAGKGYYFRLRNDPNAAPEIVRRSTDKDHPVLAAYQKPDGTWGVKEVSGQPNDPSYEPLSGNAPSTLDVVPHLSRADDTRLSNALKAREAGQKAYAAAGDNSPAKNAALKTITDQSQIVGDIGARTYVKKAFPDAKLIYGDGSSRPGDFDQVYQEKLPDGHIRFIVVEAKGGTSPLGTRVVGDQVETQGTRNYFEAIAGNMRGHAGTDAGRVGADLLSVLRTGKTPDGTPAEISYLLVKTPVNVDKSGINSIGNVSVKQFDLTEPHPDGH